MVTEKRLCHTIVLVAIPNVQMKQHHIAAQLADMKVSAGQKFACRQGHLCHSQ